MPADGTRAIDLLRRAAKPADRGGAARRAHQGDLRRVAELRLSAGDGASCMPKAARQPQEGHAADAGERANRAAAQAFCGHDRQRSRRADLPEPRQGRCADGPEPALGRRHHLHRHRGRLRLSRGDPRRLVAARGRLCDRPARSMPAWRWRRSEPPIASRQPPPGLHPSFRSRLAICCRGLPRRAREARPQGFDGPARQPLRQRQGRELHEDAQGRGGLPDGLRDLRRRRSLIAALHRRGLQQPSGSTPRSDTGAPCPRRYRTPSGRFPRP